MPRRAPGRTAVPVALVAAFALASASIGSLVGCGDDDASSPAVDAGADGQGLDAGHAGHDAGTDAADDATKEDAGPPPIRCTDAELAAGDFSDAGAATVTFNTGANPTQYTNHCITLKVGATVTFTGSFKQHPLEPYAGDTPNPIPTVNAEPAGGQVVVTFPTAGTFGYRCTFHPSSMFGAIRVVP